MIKHVLITGGAGCIGSRLADDLLDRGCRGRARAGPCPRAPGVSAPPAAAGAVA